MRDKLIKLIIDGFRNCTKPHEVCSQLDLEALADHLIANGVTFETDNNDGHKWIPLSEKYPEYKQDVLMYFDTGNMAVGFLTDGEYWSAYSDDGWFTDCDCFPLFWMPLPEIPKEVE